MSAHFADKLILAPWALRQLGMEDFDRLSEKLRAPEFEGWADDGSSRYVQQLIARLPKLGQAGRTILCAMDDRETYVSELVASLQSEESPGPT